MASNTAQEWNVIGLVFVEYPKGDTLGHVLAWCSLLPVFLSVGIATAFLMKRDLHTFFYGVGIIVNEAINWITKNVIQEPRPTIARRDNKVEYGMPSNHAQYMSFFTSYLLLFMFIRLYRNRSCVDELWKLCVSCISVVVCAAVCYGRFYLGYHTALQVLLGVGMGALCAGAWFCAVQYLISPFFPLIASWPISELFLIRDCSLIPNIMWFEYKITRVETRNRQRKLGRKSI